MDMKQRAALVRELRFEVKQRATTPWSARDPDEEYSAPYDHAHRGNSRRRMERARTRSRFQRVRPGETGSAYVGRTAEGGDSSFANAAYRYDLRRPRGSKPAPHIPDDGYAMGYSGEGEAARRRVRRVVRKR
jgi:hypothetical protein